MRKILFLSTVVFILNLFAGYEEGEEIFKDKCSSCHGEYVSISDLKKNFFGMKNSWLKLEYPPVNMIVYDIMRGSKKLGDPEDPEMQQIEIEEFLISYLEDPNRNNSLTEPTILPYLKEKTPMKITGEEASELAVFIMEYKKRRDAKYGGVQKILSSGYNEDDIINEAIKENKKILVYATSETCYFCKKMKEEVIESSVIKSEMFKNFIFIEVDVDKVKLPFGLQKSFPNITPTFFFVDQNKKLLNLYPGSWNIRDFTMILKENSK